MKTYEYGDADVNGTVNAMDAIVILWHVVKLKTITDPIARTLADIDHSGGIDATDALCVLRVVVKLRSPEYTKL